MEEGVDREEDEGGVITENREYMVYMVYRV
jgi:hypothetical protein